MIQQEQVETNFLYFLLGDCFTASFSAKLIQKNSIKDAMSFATGCAYMCITKFGAMPSLPTLEEFHQKISHKL